MMKFENANLTEGHIARHTPTGSGAPGREAAIIDIAQDFLLSYLEDKGKMDHVSLKGGTAIRKLYAGKEGRFSLDLDFSIDDPDSDPADRTLDFISEIDGEIMEIVRDFTVDGDCSHEIKRCLLLGRKEMTNLDSILKSRDITFYKGPASQSYGFSSNHVWM